MKIRRGQFCGTILISMGIFLFFVFSLSTFLFSENVVAATPPSIITYQGKLIENNEAVTTEKNMGFLIFDQHDTLVYTAAGTLSNTTTVAITPSSGIFSVDLGGTGTNTVTSSIFASSTELYLEIHIGSTKLTPRKRITSVPYAINAEYLLGISATTTSSSTYIPVSDSNGQFTFATTTFTADITVDSGTLAVDTVNNRVGVNTSTPIYDFSVSGTTYIGSNNTTNTLRFASSSQFISEVPVTSDAFAFNTANNITAGNLLNLLNNDVSKYSVDFNGNVTANSFTGDGSALTGVAGGKWSDGGGAGSDIHYSAGFVGINTSTPGFGFSVATTTYITATTTITNQFTVTGRAENPEFVGSFEECGASVADVEIRGGIAYVVGTNGLCIYNVADSKSTSLITSLKPLGFFYPGAGSGPAQIAVPNSNYAYVAEGRDDLWVFDISNTSNPKQIGRYKPGGINGDVTSITVNGNNAFVGFQDAANDTYLNILDITDPTNISVVTTTKRSNGIELSDANYITHVKIQGEYAYVAGGSLYVLNIANPESPYFTSEFTFNNTFCTSQGFALDDSYLYKVCHRGEELKIYDLADPAVPVEVKEFDFDTTDHRPYDVAKVGDYLYFTSQDDGFFVINVASSTNPHVVKQINPTEKMYNVTVSGNRLYIAQETDGFAIYDITGAKINNGVFGNIVMEELYVKKHGSFRLGLHVGNSLEVDSNIFLGGELSFYSPSTTAYTTNTIRFSTSTQFITHVVSTTNAFVLDTASTLENSSSTYLLSIRNNGTPVFSVSTAGNIHATGTIYGDSVNVATPGEPGDLAEIVDVLPNENVQPGDVMVVDLHHIDMYKKSTGAYEQHVAGIISTKPTITVGSGKTNSTATMALIGRVPVNVTTENGPIAQGDLLVTASTPGFAMKYRPEVDDHTRMVSVLGVALESFNGESGQIMSLVRSGWVNNRNQTILDIQEDLITIAQSEGIDIQHNNENIRIEQRDQEDIVLPRQSLNMNGFSISNVAAIFGKNNGWRIDGSGRFTTNVETSEGSTPLYTLQSEQNDYIFSGAGQLNEGVADIAYTQTQQDIMDPTKEVRIVVTLTEEAFGIFVHEKNEHGFSVKEMQDGESDATFDWLVVAKRRDGALVPQQDIEDNQQQNNQEPAPEEQQNNNENNQPNNQQVNNAQPVPQQNLVRAGEVVEEENNQDQGEFLVEDDNEEVQNPEIGQAIEQEGEAQDVVEENPEEEVNVLGNLLENQENNVEGEAQDVVDQNLEVEENAPENNNAEEVNQDNGIAEEPAEPEGEAADPAPVPAQAADPAPEPEQAADPAPVPEQAADPAPVPEQAADPAPVPAQAADPAPVPAQAADPAPEPEVEE